METFSVLLAICVGNSPVPGEFPTQRPVTRSFDVFFHLRLNYRLSKHWWGWWFETPSCPLWNHCNEKYNSPCIYAHIKGLVPNCSNSCMLAMELLQTCTKPSIWANMFLCKLISPTIVCSCKCITSHLTPEFINLYSQVLPNDTKRWPCAYYVGTLVSQISVNREKSTQVLGNTKHMMHHDMDTLSTLLGPLCWESTELQRTASTKSQECRAFIVSLLLVWRTSLSRNIWVASEMRCLNSLMPSDAYMGQWTNHHWFRWWFVTWSAPSHYLNHCWNIVD